MRSSRAGAARRERGRRPALAIYHLNVRGVAPARGSSAVKAAAYQSGERLVRESTGEVCRYGRRERVSASGVELPDGAPAWAADRGRLWNSAEAAWPGGRELVARRVVVAIPRELDADLALASVADLCRAWAEEGRACDWAVHDLGGPNPHAHVLVSARVLGPDGWRAAGAPRAGKLYLLRDDAGSERWAPASEWRALAARGWEKVYRWAGPDGRETRLTKSQARAAGLATSERLSKSPVARTSLGGRGGLDAEREALASLRRRWEGVANARLAEQAARDGSEPASVDCRSNAARGVEALPTIHEGPAVTAMEARARARGEEERVTDRARTNELRRELNSLAAEIERETSESLEEAARSRQDAAEAAREAEASRSAADAARGDLEALEARKRALADEAAALREQASRARGERDALVGDALLLRAGARGGSAEAERLSHLLGGVLVSEEPGEPGGVGHAWGVEDFEAWIPRLHEQEQQAERRLDGLRGAIADAEEAQGRARDAEAAARRARADAETWGRVADGRRGRADAHLRELGVTRAGLMGVLRDLARAVAQMCVASWDTARGWARDRWADWMGVEAPAAAADLGIGKEEAREASDDELARAATEVGREDALDDLRDAAGRWREPERGRDGGPARARDDDDWER